MLDRLSLTVVELWGEGLLIRCWCFGERMMEGRWPGGCF